MEELRGLRIGVGVEEKATTGGDSWNKLPGLFYD